MNSSFHRFGPFPRLLLFLLLFPHPSLSPPPQQQSSSASSPTKSIERPKKAKVGGGTMAPPTKSLDDEIESRKEEQQQKSERSNKMCPLNEHIVCNEISEPEFRCVCAMFGSADPPPEQSCTNLLNTTVPGAVEATSVKVRLSPSFFLPPSAAAAAPNATSSASSNSADNYLEQKFKAHLAWHFKINQKNILFLRLRCQDDANVIIQFIVLRRNRSKHAPFSASADLIDAQTVVRRTKGIKKGQSPNGSGGLEIMNVEKVTKLVPIEVNVDNSRLIIQALIVGAFMIITCLCGCWISCRKRRPEDEGYEDVVQQPEKV